MSKVVAVFALYADFKASCLGIAEVGTAADLEIFFLSGRPSLNVKRLNLKVGEVARATFKRSYGDVKAAEKVNRVFPKLVVPITAVLRLTNNYHFLLFELVNTVNAAFLNSVSALFLAETGGIACKRAGELIFGRNGVDKFTYHGMFACADKIKVLALDFIHHGVHFGEAHNARNYVGANHVRRNTVSKSAVNHEIAGIGNNRRMKAGDVAHKVIKSVTGNLSCTVKVNSVKLFHNFGVIGNFKIGYNRLAVFFNFNVFAVVTADGNRRVNNLRNGHHDLVKLFFKLFFNSLKLGKAGGALSYLLFRLLSLVLFALRHQRADLLGNFISGRTKLVGFLDSRAESGVKLNRLVNKRELCVLELVADVLTNNVGVFS